MVTLVRDIMSRDVLTIHCQKSVAEAAKFLAEHQVHGAPMVATDGHIMGVISTTDITRFNSDPDAGDPHSTMVWAIGTPEAVTVDASATAQEAAMLMVSHQVHRLIVVYGGTPAGIVTSLDLAAMVARG